MKPYQSQPEFLAVMSAYLSGDREVAEKAVAELLRKYPQDSSLQLLLGNIKYTVGLLVEASAHYEKALELDPGLCQAFYKLGVCLVRMGRLDEALKAFEKNVAAKCGSHAMSFYWMGLINSFLKSVWKSSARMRRSRSRSKRFTRSPTPATAATARSLCSRSWMPCG